MWSRIPWAQCVWKSEDDVRPTRPVATGLTRLLLAAGLVSLAVAPATAQRIYRYTDADGNVVFTDSPPKQGATEVTLPPVNTYTSPTRPLDLDTGSRDQPHPGYQEFSVASPKSGEVIRDNAGNVSVKLRLRPRLQPGDTIDFVVDGQSLASGKSTSALLTSMDRGSHTIEAIIRDRDGKVVAQTGSVHFDVLRRTRLLPAPRPQPLGGGGG